MKLVGTALSIVLGLSVLLNTYLDEKAVQKPQPYQTTDCTEVLEVECAVDIERTVIACAKAFETAGADVIADIKCTKDLLSDKKHCWPCICAEAQKRGWKIIGC